MQLVPIPTTDEDIYNHAPLWMPFLADIARHSGENPDDLVGLVLQHQIQVILIWDEHAQRADALIGVRIVKHGDDLVGEVVWLTGRGMERWLHLRSMLEKYLKEHCRCDVIRPFARPGWSRLMKAHGYVVTHHVMEKRL